MAFRLFVLMCKANWDGFSKELKGKLVLFFTFPFIGVSFSFCEIGQMTLMMRQWMDGATICVFFQCEMCVRLGTMGAFTGVNGVNIKSWRFFSC